MANTDYSITASGQPFCSVARLTAGVGPGDTTLHFSLFRNEALSLPAAGDPVLVGKELMLVQSVSTGLVVVGRGCGDTIPQAHSAGAHVWFLKGGVGSDNVRYSAGEQIGVKELPRGYKNPVMAIADAPAKGLGFDSRAIRPYPPGKVLVNGLPWYNAVTYEVASIPNAGTDYAPVGLSGRAAQHAVIVGDALFAFSQNGAVLHKRNVDTLASIATVTVAGSSIVTDGTYIYLVRVNTTTPPRVMKYDVDLTLVDSSDDFPESLDGAPTYGRTMVMCAGSLWVTLSDSGHLRRINPATLDTIVDIDIYAGTVATDGTYVYCTTFVTEEISKIDPATNTVVDTYALGEFPGTDICAAGGYVFTVKADGNLRITNASDMTDHTSPFTEKLGTLFSVADGYVAIVNRALAKVNVINAAALSFFGTFTIPIGSAPGGYHATILSSKRVIASNNNGENADYYDRVPGVEGDGDTLTFSWTHRDRVLQADQLVHHGEASVGPEAGTTYRLRFYRIDEDDAENLVATYTTDEDSFDYEFNDIITDYFSDGVLSEGDIINGYCLLDSHRDGHYSWQAYRIEFAATNLQPYGLGYRLGESLGGVTP